MAINIFLFVHFYLFYDQDPEFEYTRELLGVSLTENTLFSKHSLRENKIHYGNK